METNLNLKHPSHGHAARQQSHEQNNISPGYGYSEEDFTPFFNPDPNGAFNNAWDPTLVEPAVQSNGCTQQAQSWNHQTSQPLQSSGYAGSFSTAQNFTNYGDYTNSPYPTLPSTTFETSLPYAGDTVLRQQTYANPPDSGFFNGNSLVQGQTVAPSALQSYPNAFDRFSPNSDRTATPLQPDNAALRQAVNARPAGFYDEDASQAYADKIPAGKPHGDMVLKEPEELMQATVSEKVTGHLYFSVDKLDSEEPRVLFPRIAPRKSVKDIKRETLDYQNGRPWDPSQHAILKKIRIKLTARKRGRPAKGATVTAPTPVPVSETVDIDSTSESSSEESGDDSSSEESEAEEPSPLPQTRPTDDKGALEYDVVKAIWARRDTMLPTTVVKSALSRYLEIVKPIREAYRASNIPSNSSEGANPSVAMEANKAKAADTRQAMLQVLRLTLKHGHPDIVERFGSSPILISTFYTFLLDRFNEKDFNGDMSENILRVLSSCATLNQRLLEQTKLDRMLPRFVRKGNEQIKQLAQQVIDNAIKLSKQDAEDKKDVPIKGETKTASSKPTTTQEAAGVKRSRSSDTPSSQPAKRPAQPVPPRAGPSSAGVKPGLSNNTKTAASKTATSARAEPKPAANASASDSPTKPKSAVQKAPSLLSSLKPASKKPGTSIDTVKSNQVAESKAPLKQQVPKIAATPMATSKSTFSLEQTLANLGKPNSQQEVRQAIKDLPLETKEERRKRERKELRRKLRVTWKPQESLEEIRIFSHDPEEEKGHDHNMLRGVSDVQDEGRMLKLFSQRVDLEEEDEYEPEFDDDQLIPWRSPSVIDLSDADYNATMQNFKPRGGTIDVDSPERTVQEQRERNTLIAIYPTIADIPPSPREPADPYSGAKGEEVAFGQPSDEIRARETQFYNSAAPSLNVNAILQMLRTPAQSQPQPFGQAQAQYTNPTQSSLPTNNIESVFAQFSNGQANTTPAPESSMLDPSILTALSVFNSQQNQTDSQTPPQQPPQMPKDTAQPSSTPGIATLLSQLTGNQHNQSGDRKRAHDEDDYLEAKRNKAGNAKYKTLPCRFWREGTCKKGKLCTFKHE